MPSATSPAPTPARVITTSLPIRQRHDGRGNGDTSNGHSPSPRTNRLKHATSGSLSDDSLPSARDLLPNSRPHKRHNKSPQKTIAVVNASGRQAASLIRVASAVGYTVRAQLRNLEHVYAREVSDLPNVTILLGDLYATPATSTSPSISAPISSSTSPTSSTIGSEVNHGLIDRLFHGAHLAFVNTTFYGDEVAIGKALADAAVRHGIEHYIYSSMPDHSSFDSSWPALPMWSTKARVEDYIRESLGSRLPATFVYTGIYNNNFTSLPYPLFCMALQTDGSFSWTAPFHPSVPLPWLDAEHDVGPAVLQLFKDGPKMHAGARVPLAYEMLTPQEACEVFSRGVGRRVRYIYEEKIQVAVKIPQGYKDQLHALEALYACRGHDKNGREGGRGSGHGSGQPPYFGSEELEKQCPERAMQLWEGYRGLEEYAREVFPLEEAANGRKWMEGEEEDGVIMDEDREEDENTPTGVERTLDGHNSDADHDGDHDDGLVMGVNPRLSKHIVGGAPSIPMNTEMMDVGGGGMSKGILGDGPARKQESWLA